VTGQAEGRRRSQRPTAGAGAGSPARSVRWVAADALVMTGRNLRHWTRQPQLVVFSTIQPVMFILLFAYVFGGAVQIPGVDYRDFLIPGIFVQVVAFGATQTAVGLADDLAGGLVDRFRSLPAARSAVLLGRTLADACRNLFVVMLMTLVGHLIGFRFGAGLGSAVGSIAIVVAFGFALSWIFATVGLSVSSTEAAQASSFVWIFPLVFASSAFVPVRTMPGWLQAFADNQPVTKVVDAARALALGGPTARPLTQALAWIVGILAVFVPFAVARYRRSG
jgi:ABC transporter DrrB family efflux protein